MQKLVPFVFSLGLTAAGCGGDVVELRSLPSGTGGDSPLGSGGQEHSASGGSAPTSSASSSGGEASATGGSGPVYGFGPGKFGEGETTVEAMLGLEPYQNGCIGKIMGFFDPLSCEVNSFCWEPCYENEPLVFYGYHGTYTKAECRCKDDYCGYVIACETDEDCPTDTACFEMAVGKVCAFSATKWSPLCTEAYCGDPTTEAALALETQTVACDATYPCCDGFSCTSGGRCK